MGDDDYPVLRSGDVTDAFPDIGVGPVVKAFPDIRVGDVLKLDGTALDLEGVTPYDGLGLVVLEPETGDGLRIASTFAGSVGDQDLDAMLDDLIDLAGTVNVSVLRVDRSTLVCEVVDVRSARGESQS